jgi:spore germination cell wall hydrolase CwlJ-like protein
MAARRSSNRRGKRKAPVRWNPVPLMVLAGFAIAVILTWLAARGDWFGLKPPSAPIRLTMVQARALNASIPFVGGVPEAARPYRFQGTPAAREQAIQCLATAAIYEAGGDAEGQKAVMQVVLNRVALPGYPKTVCGVVYQGSGRATGCQFSFTCDGSVQRRPEHAGWPEAREAARRALEGAVFAPVGTATHYHTDWTAPYWLVTLDKIAQIRSHIFYRPHRMAAPPPPSG